MLECLFCIALSPLLNTYDNSIQSDWGGHISVGRPLSVFVSYESPRMQIVGQNAPFDMWGAGLGAEKDFGPVSLSLEIGHFWPNPNIDDNIRNEIVNTTLRNNHGQPKWKPTAFEYGLDNGWGGRIEASIEMTQRFSIFGAYRYLSVNESMDMCEIGPCEYGESGRHWQERNARNLSSWQVGVTLDIGK